MPPACPIEQKLAGSDGEHRQAAQEHAGQRPPGSALIRIRDLQNGGSGYWGRMVLPRLAWLSHREHTARQMSARVVLQRGREDAGAVMCVG